MKHQNSASAGAQTKTLLVMVSCMAGSLVLATTVVTFLIKFLGNS